METSEEGTNRALATASEELIRRFQAGDAQALERLWTRYLPRLKRWAHGRLPPSSRSETDTDDLVQDAFVKSLARLRTLTPQGRNSVFAYFRAIVLNQVRDYARRAARRPLPEVLDSGRYADPEPSALERMLGAEPVRRYEAALATLSTSDQEIVTAFIELGCNDRELAELFEKPSADAARMARTRALARLARALSMPGWEAGPDGRR
jgi:RNA polymerase sigma-70 factor, ECF subfamily